MTAADHDGGRPVTCAWCGTVAADGPPLDWMGQTAEGGRVEHLCSACARANLRSVEARLDTEWW